MSLFSLLSKLIFYTLTEVILTAFILLRSFGLLVRIIMIFQQDEHLLSNAVSI